MVEHKTLGTRIQELFFNPADNAPLILFRIFFGLLLFLESVGAIFTGWVKECLIAPAFTFTFIGFEWLQPLPGSLMYHYYLLMGLIGLMIMAGCCYRWSAAAFFLLWTAVYLMQKSDYNNHYYLLVLLSLIMVFMPAAADVSLDSRRKRTYSRTCPRWCLLVFQFQFALVYFFAGINKLYADWIGGNSVNTVFAHKTGYPIIGPLLSDPYFRQFITYGGILFDLFIIPALLYHRTRAVAFVSLLIFHLFNSAVFQIGIFPYLMIAASVFFFPPEKLRALFFRNRDLRKADHVQLPSPGYRFPATVIIVYMFIQAALPLRPFLYPGRSNWTEEGHRLSWRMMLRFKKGTVYFTIRDVTRDTTWIEDPARYLTARQLRSLSNHPDIIWQFAQRLKKEWMAKGVKNPQIYAHSMVSLNGKPAAPMIDSLTDLASVEWNIFLPSDWILKRYEEPAF